ncbi:MAG: hypothetical protein CMP48_23855 [Rickettsiales bacterium]|nr:hypothetical protein [Rickettsiales bacterium]
MKVIINNEKIILSTIWVFVLMNMIYADILNTLKPEYLDEIAYVAQNFSGETVLLFAILMEVPIAMILLSRLLNRKYNRLLNLIAAPMAILWVIIPSFVINDGDSPLSYLFFATIETIAMLTVIWICYKWKKEKVSTATTHN